MNKSNAATNSNDSHLLRFHCIWGITCTISSVNISVRNSPIFQVCKLRLRELSPLPRANQPGSSLPPDILAAQWIPFCPPSLLGLQENKNRGGRGAGLSPGLALDPDLQPVLFRPRSYYEESNACAPGQQGCESRGRKRFGEPNA